MGVLLASLPVVVVIAALLLGQSSTRAGGAGAATAALVACTAFTLTLPMAVEAALTWWPLVLEVLLIMAGGIAFAEAGRRSGDQQQLSGWLRACLGTGLAPVLAIVHGVTPFAESVTGFGVGAMISVPLLSALGLDGRRAAAIGLLGLCASPWGSLGPGTLIAAELSGVSFQQLGVASAVASLPVFVGVGVAAALLVTPRGQRSRAAACATGSGLVLWLGVLGANLVIGTVPAGAVGAIITLGFHLLLRRLAGRPIAWSAQVRRALIPYAALLGGVTLAAAAVRRLALEGTASSLLDSPVPWLVLATAITVTGRCAVPSLLGGAARRWVRVGPATGLFMILGVLMSSSGMAAAIAAWCSQIGAGYVLVVPAIGALGGFLTGSNSGANAMFAVPQAQAATAIGAGVLPVVAVHNVCASLLCLASPARIELAVSLCPDPPSRAQTMRTLLTVCAAVITVLAIGLAIAAAM